MPFNIPFKKGYIKHIIIKERIYNEKYSKGSIFSEITDFTLKGNKAVIKTYLEFSIDEKIQAWDRATLESSIPFIMSEEEISKINEILDNIKSNYQAYDKNKKNFSPFDPEYFNYTYIRINDVDYSIKKDDEILSKIRWLIRYTSSAEAIYNAYNCLTK